MIMFVNKKRINFLVYYCLRNGNHGTCMIYPLPNILLMFLWRSILVKYAKVRKKYNILEINLGYIFANYGGGVKYNRSACLMC